MRKEITRFCSHWDEWKNYLGVVWQENENWAVRGKRYPGTQLSFCFAFVQYLVQMLNVIKPLTHSYGSTRCCSEVIISLLGVPSTQLCRQNRTSQHSGHKAQTLKVKWGKRRFAAWLPAEKDEKCSQVLLLQQYFRNRNCQDRASNNQIRDSGSSKAPKGQSKGLLFVLKPFLLAESYQA